MITAVRARIKKPRRQAVSADAIEGICRAGISFCGNGL